MSDTTRWWWVRHAPVPNREGRILGHADVAADLSDAAGIRALADCLPREALWVTTTLGRARDTARLLAVQAAPAAGLREDDRFREQNFGAWDGGRWDDLPAAESAAYWRNPAVHRPPGGESFADLVGRVAAAIDGLGGEGARGDVVIVAHAGSIRAALVHALRCTPEAGLAFHIAPLSLTRLDSIHRDGGVWWRVCGVNLSSRAPN